MNERQNTAARSENPRRSGRRALYGSGNTPKPCYTQARPCRRITLCAMIGVAHLGQPLLVLNLHHGGTGMQRFRTRVNTG